ncbi:hypothetical protein K227x_61600 [Rubripirellula lacrimiformis]|uniref:Uncharacterized protein n=1 Tax=Rubripirellula lacrimiformis TaxID=1930273 RepID=A0A517NKS0_9BACT|nr:DUF4153 domain-containing protein [Rubripirellula lacrimiformis]QDT07732.1 hypothetical protein K227x_61600 [Rubripirellula lacrimiformis]
MTTGEVPQPTKPATVDTASVDRANVDSVRIDAAPLAGREIVAAILWMILADVFLFRAVGFSGPAVFLAAAPILFVALFPNLLARTSARWTIGIMAVVVARLIWLGSAWTLVSGIVLVVAISMIAAGSVPMVLEGIVLASRSLLDGAVRLGQSRLPQQLGGGAGAKVAQRLLSILLPIVAAGVFGAIFLFANPDLLERFSARLMDAIDGLFQWANRFSAWEIPFCIAALLIGIGLMRPALPLIRFGTLKSDSTPPSSQTHSPWFAAFRNTLVTVIVLFAVYLGFEWLTLWRREFPAGFYYAGYAHQGAAWLTVALALATGMLSLIFRGSILADPRLASLKRLTWVWSGANLLLAVAVYNRLLIYVGYNGMTQMRTVGFFGITLVVIGFALVLYKIRRGRNFWWLIRTQLVALVLTIIAYSVFPVDYVTSRYNASRVAQGYLPPSVMIAVKPTNDEGVAPLLDLVDCEDEIIREGVLAILAQRHSGLQYLARQHGGAHWTAYQGSQSWLRNQLAANASKWSEFESHDKRSDAIRRFEEYAMQWY